MKQSMVGCLLFAMLAIPAFGAGLETMKVPLRYESFDNTVADGGLVRLRREYKQEGDKPIVFEAEEATIIEHHSMDKRIMKDAQCSVGYYLHYVKKMEYDFTVETPGQYQVRFRSWFPLKAGYSHSEYMDDGEMRNVVDSQFHDQEIWFWTEGSVYELTQGKHRYFFPSPSAFCAGARIDKVVFFPVGKDEVKDLGPSASPMTTPLTGTVVTKRINLRRIKSWQMNYEIVENGGKAVVEYSFDKEKWVSAPYGKSIDVPTPKPRFIYFRFTLNGKEGQPSPWVQGVDLQIVKEK